ncbi:hypothetical protein M569_09646 [Genlisea aurea]|uniref:Uncharacterized protein n=1 Tax=Genlisea aurea TaxID=192259 RepID=S8DYN5_9LAMI|nr:hypothetical protein M569_09646 [Genlisea aurea]
MVLWEITLGTAYFLGLKRTYRLALRIQRKLVGPNHPKIRQVFQSRSRVAFDLALRAHLAIQERDIEVGRSLGNRILRWLDKMKPEAHIRGPPPPPPPNSSATATQRNIPSQLHNRFSKQATTTRGGVDRESDRRRLFSVARSFWGKPFPSFSMTTKRISPPGIIQYRQIQHSLRSDQRFSFGNNVIRNDIKLWLQH